MEVHHHPVATGSHTAIKKWDHYTVAATCSCNGEIMNRYVNLPDAYYFLCLYHLKELKTGKINHKLY